MSHHYPLYYHPYTDTVDARYEAVIDAHQWVIRNPYPTAENIQVRYFQLVEDIDSLVEDRLIALHQAD